MSNNDQMSAEELAKLFKEQVPQKSDKAPSLATDNGIYQVSARIKNAAKADGLSLTRAGDMLCNTYTHVMLAFYQFAETLKESDRERLEVLIRKQEEMPAIFIAAAFAQTKKK